MGGLKDDAIVAMLWFLQAADDAERQHRDAVASLRGLEVQRGADVLVAAP